MIDVAALSPPVQATLLVGLIFLQAVILYVGYGLLERMIEPVVKTLTDT